MLLLILFVSVVVTVLLFLLASWGEYSSEIHSADAEDAPMYEEEYYSDD